MDGIGVEGEIRRRQSSVDRKSNLNLGKERVCIQQQKKEWEGKSCKRNENIESSLLLPPHDDDDDVKQFRILSLFSLTIFTAHVAFNIARARVEMTTSDAHESGFNDDVEWRLGGSIEEWITKVDDAEMCGVVVSLQMELIYDWFHAAAQPLQSLLCTRPRHHHDIVAAGHDKLLAVSSFCGRKFTTSTFLAHAAITHHPRENRNTQRDKFGCANCVDSEKRGKKVCQWTTSCSLWDDSEKGKSKFSCCRLRFFLQHTTATRKRIFSARFYPEWDYITFNGSLRSPRHFSCKTTLRRYLISMWWQAKNEKKGGKNTLGRLDKRSWIKERLSNVH